MARAIFNLSLESIFGSAFTLTEDCASHKQKLVSYPFVRDDNVPQSLPGCLNKYVQDIFGFGDNGLTNGITTLWWE